MNDILPTTSHRWQKLETTVGKVLAAYGYSQIRLPIVEQTAVFERSIYRSAFLFDVDLYGLGFIYQRGYRAETQVINHMIAPKRCMLCKTLPIKGFVAKYEFSSLGPDMWQWQLRCSLCSSATKEENKLSLDEMAKKLKIQII